MQTRATLVVALWTLTVANWTVTGDVRRVIIVDPVHNWSIKSRNLF